MKHLTYNEYITAKYLIQDLCKMFNLEDCLYDHEDELREHGFTVSSGVSKYVLYNEDELPGWVIKFDRNKNDYPFDGCSGTYCDIEYQNFRLAVKAGFDCYFATTKKIISIDGWNFYLAEYVQCSERDIENTFIDTLMDSGCFDSREDAYDCLDCQDADEVVQTAFGDDAFSTWIDAMGINDLHCGNWGINSDGNLVIIDYSGY